MDLRYATGPDQVSGMDTDELRRRFLVRDLFRDDRAEAVYTHHDRLLLVGVKPVTRAVALPAFPQLAAESFFENREAGIVNVGGPGTVVVDGAEFEVGRGACLYVGRGARDVVLTSTEPDGAGGPGCFYLASAPAHTACPTTLVGPGGGTVRELGDALTSDRRTLRQLVHAGGVQSCQLVMGMTTLHPGSLWNTVPAHTHERRTEAYLYVDLPDDARVVHLLGEPARTRHLIVANREAVISPGWSVHSGVGTASYSFVWAMAGENKAFDDLDPHPVTGLR